MTEQLMDDLSNEEHEALLLMSEHGIAAPLSPAADAVLDASNLYPCNDSRQIIAATLRAAADQLQKRKPRPSIGIDWSSSELYAIANELESTSV
jgi:hypothetical protein